MIKKSSFFFIISLFLITSCADEELAPIIDFSNLQFGAYVRALSSDNASFDLENPGSATFNYAVEFVDIERGATVQSYSVSVGFKDNSPSNGDSSKGEQLWKTFSSSEFSTSANGYASLETSVSLSELTSLLGLDSDDLFARDEFEFTSEITTSEGVTHNSGNSSATVNGSAFAGFFDFDISLFCGIPDSDFVGEYTLTYEETPTGGLGPAFGETPGTVTLARTSASGRSFTVTYLPGSDNENEITFAFELLCNITEVATIGTGLSCVTGTEATITQSEEGFGSFDIDNDSSLTLNFTEFAKDGGCSQDAAEIKIKLTKN